MEQKRDERALWQESAVALLDFQVGEKIRYCYWVNEDNDLVGIRIDLPEQQYDISMAEWEKALVKIFHITSINHTKEALEKFFMGGDPRTLEEALKEHHISYVCSRKKNPSP